MLLSCPGGPAQCDDGDACTDDRCDPGGSCVHTAKLCDDLNACTDDACHPSTGCVFTPDDGNTCSDGNACTIDACTAGVCAPIAPLDCPADGVACTDEVCDPSTGCTHQFHTERCPTWPDSCSRYECEVGGCTLVSMGNGTDFCDDHNACTANDRCWDSMHCTGSWISCVDNDDCTWNDCNPAVGCVYTPKCNDGNDCTLDLCDEASSACTHVALAPPSIDSLHADADRVTFRWTALDAAWFDVARGVVGEWPIGTGSEACIAPHATVAFVEDPSLPGTGGVYWYLVRPQNDCYVGSWGHSYLGGATIPRVVNVCP